MLTWQLRLFLFWLHYNFLYIYILFSLLCWHLFTGTKVLYFIITAYTTADIACKCFWVYCRLFVFVLLVCINFRLDSSYFIKDHNYEGNKHIYDIPFEVQPRHISRVYCDVTSLLLSQVVLCSSHFKYNSLITPYTQNMFVMLEAKTRGYNCICQYITALCRTDWMASNSILESMKWSSQLIVLSASNWFSRTIYYIMDNIAVLGNCARQTEKWDRPFEQ